MENSLQNHTRIKDWPQEERPREKLLLRGAASLSDAELLAIIIRTGVRQDTALDLARKILSNEKSLGAMARMTAGELMRIRGIGKAKAVELIAAFELGRRSREERNGEKLILRSPDDVARYMMPLIRDRDTEGFYVLLLDAQNGLKRQVELTTGTLNASLVHPREVFKTAIDGLAASVIVVHNHPSGNPEPSREDIEVTRQLVEAGRITGIPVNDHLIIAGGSFTSFAERGLL